MTNVTKTAETTAATAIARRLKPVAAVTGGVSDGSPKPVECRV